MPRKVKDVLPPAVSTTDAPPNVTLSPPSGNGKPKRGRPSKEEAEARKQAARAANMLAPEDAKPVTRAVLGALAIAIKGDAATDDEVQLVNGPLVAVANKYDLAGRWLPELALLGSLLIVAGNMRSRRREKLIAAGAVIDAKRNPSSVRAQGLGEDAASAPISDAPIADPNG